MCYSLGLHVAVNVCINCSFFTFYYYSSYKAGDTMVSVSEHTVHKINHFSELCSTSYLRLLEVRPPITSFPLI